MLRWRAATALVLAPIALATIALGKWAILLVLLVVIAGAAYELSRALEPLPFLAAFGAGAAPLLFSPHTRDGVVLILIAVVRPWISDSGACFAGRFFGRHLLFPSLSPKIKGRRRPRSPRPATIRYSPSSPSVGGP
jgi:phosphatidate cytidylyltransferase